MNCLQSLTFIDTHSALYRSFKPVIVSPSHFNIKHALIMTYQISASSGSLPGLFERIQGLLSQKSSLMKSTCSTTTCAFRRSLRSLSCCDLDGCFSEIGVLSSSKPETGFGFGSSNWYCTGIRKPDYIEKYMALTWR